MSYVHLDDGSDEPAVDPADLEQLDAAGVRSLVIVPLTARRRRIGAIALLTAGGRVLSADMVTLADELARRAAVAIDNARLFEDRNEVARALQRSLLPPQLPTIGGIELAARYAPADHDIGGDFYDVFQLPTGAWLVALGDVCGKGPSAAAMTGLIRSAVRAVAVTEVEPCSILARVNDAMLTQLDDNAPFTMVVAVLAPDGAGAVDVTLCCGGHPAPLIVRAGGIVEQSSSRGMLLGAFADPPLAAQRLRLSPNPPKRLSCLPERR